MQPWMTLAQALRADVPEAREQALAAIAETRGNAVHTARRLGIGHRTWCELVAELSWLARAQSDARRVA